MIEKIYGDYNNISCVETEYSDFPVFGFDTETPNYTIRLLPISNGFSTNLIDVSAETILEEFIEYFRSVDAKTIYIFAHNLQFDFTVLMNQDLYDDDNMQLLNQQCQWKYGDVTIKFLNTTPYFASMRYDSGKVLEIRDTFSFFGRVKLSKLALSLKIGTKLKVDNEDFYREGIHKERSFRQYAKEDSRLTALIGREIMKYHAMENVSICVSSPQMAMKVFRKKFLTDEDSLIAPPNDEMMRAFELSYHGGKNGCYVIAPREYKNIKLYDINSAYPFAMSEIPNFNHCSYHHYRSKKAALTVSDKYEGIYKINCVSNCKYNSTFDHDFSPLKTLKKIWITSYELKSLIKHNCIEDLIIWEKILIIPDKKLHNPLADYANYYYALKATTSKTSPLYEYYKRGTLNSLYGKFIERRYSDMLPYSTRGPSYNPAIASLITGHARAYLHDLEHAGNSIHSATDSVFTTKTMPTSKGLGGLTLEGKGNVLLFRTKFYVFKDKTGKIIKYATHGFHGKVEQATRLWKKRGMPNPKELYHGKALKNLGEYVYQKMPTAGEFFLHKKLKLKLFGMNDMKSTIKLHWENIDNEKDN